MCVFVCIYLPNCSIQGLSYTRVVLCVCVCVFVIYKWLQQIHDYINQLVVLVIGKKAFNTYYFGGMEVLRIYEVAANTNIRSCYCLWMYYNVWKLQCEVIGKYYNVGNQIIILSVNERERERERDVRVAVILTIPATLLP